ncbi:hypothetical protein ElyMa_004553200 [Elysia marginata]|uniref:Uncharacterized protein n=1 Tax=Elysia marginata TaxID=1093978 RepID=A0AAV4HUM5_9GAST|nr:hypothetical protein ElyMa_004553200 [Elysia marginata]
MVMDVGLPFHNQPLAVLKSQARRSSRDTNGRRAVFVPLRKKDSVMFLQVFITALLIVLILTLIMSCVLETWRIATQEINLYARLRIRYLESYSQQLENTGELTNYDMNSSETLKVIHVKRSGILYV